MQKAIRKKQAANAAINETEQKKKNERERPRRSRAEKALETKPLGATATSSQQNLQRKTWWTNGW